MPRPLTWVAVPGGTCLYGDTARPIAVQDLWWTATPVTRLEAGLHGDLTRPVTGLSHAAAQALASTLGGRLPRSVEWEWMAAGPERRRYPWGDHPPDPRLAQLAWGPDQIDDGPGPVGTHPDGATPEGMHDVAGCVWEWTATPTMGAGGMIRGGSYASSPLYAQCTFRNAAPRELTSPGIGLRVVRPA